ncbi:MAG: PHP domain-containing protein [Lachnospiraceae bacterium]|nr:PHP domain-containing protein [Lachnospiraceae bacterium]
MHTVDLHVHSNYSDGTCTPVELVQKARDCGIQAMALTDHDTVDGIPHILSAAADTPGSPEIIPGTELSVGFRDRDIHIVGLFIDYTYKDLKEMSAVMIARRDARNEEMAERFRKDGIPITMEELTEGNPDTVVTRAHFARLLIKYGVVKNTAEAFNGYLDQKAPYYVPREYYSREQGIQMILAAGGVPILAHPLLYNLSEKEIRDLLAELKDYGLMGLEVKYSTYSKQDETFAMRLAKEFELLPSGGSDFHGSNKPAISLGTGMGNLAVPEEYLEAIRTARA